MSFGNEQVHMSIRWADLQNRPHEPLAEINAPSYPLP